MLTLSKTDLNLDQPPLQIKGKGDDGMAADAYVTDQCSDLLFVEQQFTHPTHIVVEAVSEVVMRNMDIVEPHFAPVHSDKSLLQLDRPCPAALDFGP